MGTRIGTGIRAGIAAGIGTGIAGTALTGAALILTAGIAGIIVIACIAGRRRPSVIYGEHAGIFIELEAPLEEGPAVVRRRAVGLCDAFRLLYVAVGNGNQRYRRLPGVQRNDKFPFAVGVLLSGNPAGFAVRRVFLRIAHRTLVKRMVALAV